MTREKFGIAVSEELVDRLENAVEECEDLDASRSEIIEAVLTSFYKSEIDHINKIRELIIRRRKGEL